MSDLTYIKTGEGWVYLTAILDLANRKVEGWALSETMRAEDTSVAAFKMALKCYPIKNRYYFTRTEAFNTRAESSVSSWLAYLSPKV